MPPDCCPYAPRIAAQLVEPGARLDDDLAQHLPGCEACWHAASIAIRAWATDRSATPSLVEWLGATATIVSRFQAEAIAGGRTAALELGPYLLLDRLGAGGMGDVYRAWHRLLRREDAVKTVRAPELASHATAVKRFLREAESAAKLRHPNVVQVYTADRTGAGYYIAMEFVPGTDLGKLVRSDGALPVATACDYVRQAADGLHHAYTNGLVHRDVKPANLLVTEDRCTVKVADFGLARAFEEGASEFTSTGAVLGTTDYMAPEQGEDARSADTRADVYALGCTLYFLLAGEVPYPGGGIRNKLERHATAPVPDVTARRSDVPDAVGAIVQKCMAKRSEDRYQTPGELSAALRALDPAPRVVAVPAPPPPDPFDLSVLAPQEEPTVLMPPERAEPDARDHPRRGSRWVWAGVGVLLLAGAAVVVTNLPKGNESAKGGSQPDAPAGGAPPVQAKPSGPVPVGSAPKPPARVPLPKVVGEPPWRFAACWSERTDKVRVVGFLADGSICAGREGSKKDGSDAGYWEVWAQTGGAALRSGRPAGTGDYEFPVCVHPHALVTERFRRFEPVAFKPIGPLSTDLAGNGGRADSLDAAGSTGNGKFVVGTATPSEERRTTRRVVEWEADTGKVRTAWPVETSDDMKTVATDHTGETAATATREGRLVVVSASGKRNREWTGPSAANEVALSPDGKRLYSAHREKAVLVWTVDDGKHEAELPLTWLVAGMAVSPDGRWLAAVGEAVIVWDLDAKPPVGYELAEHWAGDLMSAAFSADSKRLVVGGWARRGQAPEVGEGVVWLWELKP